MSTVGGGGNSSTAQTSNTDGEDYLNKPGDVAKGTDTEKASFSSWDTVLRNYPSSSSPSYTSSTQDHDEVQRGEPPVKRKQAVRRASPEATVRASRGRGGRRARGRKMTGGMIWNGRDSRRILQPSPAHPPVDLDEPPRSDKFDFIPVLTDDMKPEDRIAMIQSSMADLKVQYLATKSSLKLVEKRKERLKERERQKEVLKKRT